mgnify:CR=1 FL=1
MIGFDADDTLWVNETYFLETEQKLRLLLAPYVDSETVSAELFRTESRNMPLYGYGVKAYILSVSPAVKSRQAYWSKSWPWERNNSPSR